MIEEIMDNVKNKNPLVHCITNYVTVNDCANAVLAVNGSPIMADDEDEVEDITSICQVLVINIGTLNKRTVNAMIKAGKKANELGHPVVLDPVGAGASQLRSETTFKLLEEIKFSVIRGNISEIKTVYSGSGQTSGVDANVLDIVTKDNLEQTVAFAKELSKRTGAIISITGAIDIVASSDKAYVIYNGCKEMSRITGTGCMLSAIIGAYVAANQSQMLEAVCCGVGLMGYSGEVAKQKVEELHLGTGTMRSFIIDALSMMTSNELTKGLRYEEK